MFKNVADLVTLSPSSLSVKVDATRTIRDLFIAFHGAYGNLFLSKFQTGEVDTDGKDKGIKSAMKSWSHDLRGYDDATIEQALVLAKRTHKEFPPSCPQFVDFCEAAKPREAQISHKLRMIGDSRPSPMVMAYRAYNAAYKARKAL